ncbi:hypothetical protein BHE74_00053950 [Ensete ventricosum]|nr:hypothetical protein BHE74_00053950 [Ensete ventricosum]RZS00357.1 hypothetical protein BHM03_00030052 [Ensete ventricosum]
MASCLATHHRWTLRALVAAYLDLALAYIFLCAASLAFFASKFLALIGLPLPCSCDDIHDAPHFHREQRQQRVGCLQLLLAGVFDSVYGNDCRASSNVNCDSVQLVGAGDDDGGGGHAVCGLLEMGQGEESCGSFSHPPPPHEFDGGESCSDGDADLVDLRGKAVFRQGQRLSVLRRRRRDRNNLTIRCYSSPTSPSPALQLGWKGAVADASPSKISNHLPQVEGSGHVVSEALHHLSDDQNAFIQEVAFANEFQTVDKGLPDATEGVCEAEKNESDAIRELKQALEEERYANAALSLELEKERSAAASAADEAMAMILRLQEEKAAIKMEAWQYQRMVEEKSAYDKEEMEILKEIILQWEKEKLILDKEAEEYQQMVIGGNGFKKTPDGHLPDATCLIGQNKVASFGSFDDPELMLKEVYESIKKKERVNDEMQCVNEGESLMASVQKSSAEFVKCSSSLEMATDVQYSSSGNPSWCNSLEKYYPGVPDDGNECTVQEKGMVTIEVGPCSLHSHKTRYANESCSPRFNGSQQNDLDDSISQLVDGRNSKQDEKDKITVPLDDLCMRHNLNANKESPNSSQLNNEVNVVDVHVISHKVDLAEGKTKQVYLPQVGYNLGRSHEYGTLNRPSLLGRSDHVTEDSDRDLTQLELNMQRSSSDVTKVGQSTDASIIRASWLDLRRSSMPAVESERFQLENEVELLRRRLKAIEQGREKLSFSLEQREKETYNLRRLEEIAHQLQEIRKATESGNSIYSASLPPSSKVCHYGPNYTFSPPSVQVQVVTTSHYTDITLFFSVAICVTLDL